MEEIDIVIIGAGWFGLTIAKTYSQVHPDAEIVILESASSAGGTWASHRLYPMLKSNNLLGTYENPDFPMVPEKFGAAPGQHVPGQVTHRYLTEFAKAFNVWGRIRFNTNVEEVEQDPTGRWIITITTAQDSDSAHPTISKNILANKLIIAVGVTGNPNMPDLPGSEDFAAPLFHAKEFLRHQDLFKTANKVAVYGASKSGFDAVYAYASAGLEVEWVIRESGRGPCWMAPMFVTPLKIWLEQMVFTRLLTWFNPSIWSKGDGYSFWRRFLHNTWVGRGIVGTFWYLLEKDVLDWNGFNKDPRIDKLKPWSGAYWSGTSLSIMNYSTDFYQYVRNGRVKVHHADITHLTSNTIHLSTGEPLKVDALHCSTGWKHEPTIKFSPPSLASRLGMPSEDICSPSALTAKADAEILRQFPFLKKQPNLTPKRKLQEKPYSSSGKTPYRAYRYIAPPAIAHSRNFAVAGTVLSLAQPVTAQLQALWIIAYLDGTLALPSVDELEYATEIETRFGHWRYPGGFGDKHGDVVFDSLPYCDTLLKDLGLKFKRKGGLWKELTDAYRPEDYRGLVDEFVQLHSKIVPPYERATGSLSSEE